MVERSWDHVDQGMPTLPEAIETMEPGPELARLLESVDRSQLNGYETVALLQARSRQIAHLQAEFYDDVLEMAQCPPGYKDSPPERLAYHDQFASDELRAALSMTRRSAENQLNLACMLDHHPRIHELLRRGHIDVPRARVLCDNIDDLEADEAETVLDSILGDAPELTTGQLSARLRKLRVQVNPQAATKRYKRGVEDRRTEGRQNPDGTSDLLGRQLPTDRVAAINAAAQKLRGKDDRTIDQIRADIFMDLLEGRTTEIPNHKGGVEIRVGLTTLLGLDETPGDLAGWGPVISDLARQIVERQTNGEWRVVVTDPDSGAILHTGLTRRRPTAAQRRHVEARNPTCVFKGCRMPATSSHLDHTTDWAAGGQTWSQTSAPPAPTTTSPTNTWQAGN